MEYNDVEIKGIGIGGNCPVRVMGIVNLSPESFYGESIVTDDRELRIRIISMEKQGAAIIDIGGASTAPPKVYGTQPITVDEEISRIESALRIITRATELPISIDTTSAAVAETALQAPAPSPPAGHHGRRRPQWSDYRSHPPRLLVCLAGVRAQGLSARGA